MYIRAASCFCGHLHRLAHEKRSILGANLHLHIAALFLNTFATYVLNLSRHDQCKAEYNGLVTLLVPA